MGMVFMGGVCWGLGEGEEVKALGSQGSEELRKHYGLETADVQEQDVLYIAAIEELGRCLAESDVLSGGLHVTGFEPFDSRGIVLFCAARLRAVPQVVLEVQGDLPNMLFVLFLIVDHAA